MDIVDYLERLRTFYTEIQRFPFVRVIHDDVLEQVTLRFRENVICTQGDLGFKARNSCYITNKRAHLNVDIIESFMDKSLDIYLRTIYIKRNKCHLIAYNIYGGRCFDKVLKFTSINLF